MSTPSDLPIIVTRLAAREPSPEAAPGTAVAVRHRTPVYGILHASRGTAHQRVVARQGITVPRAYHAIRHRSGESVTVAPPVEISEAPIHDREAMTTPAIVASSSSVKGDVAQMKPALHQQPRQEEATGDPRRSQRRAARRIDPQGIGRQSRLWGLLMSILLIVAISVTLLLIFGG